MRKPNLIERNEDKIIKIFLTQGRYTLIDEGDYDKVKDYRWYIRKEKCYAVLPTINGFRKEIILSRVVTECSDEYSVIYNNSDTLDNRKSNLKIIPRGGRKFTPNKFEFVGDGTIKIFLYGEKYTIIDSEDYDKVKHLRWSRSNKYVQNMMWVNKKFVYTKLHRLITNCPDELSVDHKNHDGFDNRKCNLRNVTQQQNIMNSSIQENSSSKYKGVSWHKSSNRWMSYIGINNKLKHLGRFDDEKDAARAYNDKATELFGEYAYLNEIETGE